jgi:type VI secretion system protein ImpB
MAQSSQKFIGRNRPPRVQIEYDVELYGSEKKVQIPFVMGVLADLAGKPKPGEPITPVEERKFLDIDVDNFNDRLKAMKPHVAFDVPNVLTGEGNLKVDITFESMDDFSPAAVASKVEGVKELLEARTQLENLLTHMDGKSGAEELIAKLINDPSLLQALVSAPKPAASPADEPSTENASDGEE